MHASTMRTLLLDVTGVLVLGSDPAPLLELGMDLQIRERIIVEHSLEVDRGVLDFADVLAEINRETARAHPTYTPVSEDAYFDAIARGLLVNDALIEYARSLGKERVAILTDSFERNLVVIDRRMRFSSWTRGVIASYEHGMTKHDPRLFGIALERLGWIADETVFVDDSSRNVEIARSAGLRAIRFDGDSERLIERLRPLLG